MYHLCVTSVFPFRSAPQDFESYWAEHGDWLVWQAWVARYSDYMDPAVWDHATLPVDSEEVVVTEVCIL